MDRVEAMQVFVRVAECGSFTKAAETLRMPRASVSAAVQQLESRVGARLLSRTTRRVNLTQEGTAFFERCTQVLSDLDEIETLFLDAPTKLAGRLKIDAPGRIARRFIAPALPSFFREYPDLHVELGATDRAIDLVQEGVDCVIRVGIPAESSLVARRIGMLKQITCASPDYLAEHGTPRTLDDLTQHAAIHYIAQPSGEIACFGYFEDGNLRVENMRGSVTVNNAETYVACCIAGLGLIQIPAFDVNDDLSAGRLVEVMPQCRAPSLPVSVLYPHRRQLTQRVQVFVNWFSALLEPHLER